MNEAAGFIMDVPNSNYFAHTLRRAIVIAERHSHRLATPEHLLMALLDDPDAKDMLEGARADVTALKMKLGEVVNLQMNSLHAPGVELRPSLEFDRVLGAAADLASRSPRRERDGAFVLAALIWEPEGPAANLLRQSGLSREIALAWLNAFRSSNSPKPQPGAGSKTGPRPGPPAPAQQPPSKPESRLQQDPVRLDPLSLRSEPVRSEPMKPEPLKPEAARMDPIASEPQRSAPRQEASKEEETLEEMLARVRSILDDEEPAHGAPQRQAEQAGPAADALDPSVPRPFPPRQPEPQPAPAPIPGQGGHSRTPPSGPPDRPQEQRPQEQRLQERSQAPLPFGGLPRSPAAAAIHPPGPPHHDQNRPAPLTPSRSLAPIVQPKPRSELDKLVENIPRVMKAEEAERIEVRLSKANTAALLSGLKGRGELTEHNVIVTRAMSVMLRAPDGGFIIENLSPETQWIVDRPSFIETEPFGRWRWMVTPQRKGEHRLLLIISSRNVDENGMIGDTPLPDQEIEVMVQTNIRRSAEIAALWAGLIIAGGVLTEAAAWTMKLLLN
jgi:hypothetical protein